MYQAELLAERDTAEAQRILDSIRAAVEESGSQLVNQRFGLSELLVRHMAGNPVPADRASVDFALCRSNLGLDHALQRLIKLGVVVPPEQST